jgi:hypothetical protein
MKNSSKVMLLAAVSGAAFMIYLIRRGNTKKRMLSNISNEGYETASDILFPGKDVSSKLHYGPVLPR